MKKSIFTLLFCLLGSVLFAQTKGAVKGKVTDEQNYSLPGATVFIRALSVGTSSDLNGEFQIPNLVPGSYEIEIAFIGYAKKTESVLVEAGKTSTVSLKMKQTETVTEDVIVMGERLQGQAKALAQQQNDLTIGNVISSDQAGKFPDANIGDAMKRIPGITMQYDQGEARFGLIRGTAADLSSVTINGERVPSAEGSVRSVQLDLIPADMIQTIQVTKALTPEMDADAIGGTANLVTRSVPNGLRISGTGATGMNFLSGKPIWTGGLIVGNRFFKEKIGFMASASYNNHQLGSDNIEAVWAEKDGKAVLNEFQIRQYYLQRIRQSYSASFDFKLSPTSVIYLRGIYNHRNDWENRFRVSVRGMDKKLSEDGTNTDTEIRLQTKAGSAENKNRRLEDQRTWSLNLNGDHLIAKKIKFTWSTVLAKASEERPNERYIDYRVRKISVRQDVTDSEKPTYTVVNQADIADEKWSLREITEQQGMIEEKDFNGRFDWEIPLTTGEKASVVRFGGRFRKKDKKQNTVFYSYSPLNEELFENFTSVPTVEMSKDNFLPGDYKAGKFVDEKFIGGLQLNDATQFERGDEFAEYLGNNYSANEFITAGYLRFDQKFSQKLLMIAGLRYENTQISYKGNQVVLNEDGDYDASQSKSIEKTSQYANILPSVHVKYDLNEKTVLRFAWTNTLARPRYFDLVPYRQISFEDNALTEGNPALKPTLSMNFDLMAEHYFESVGIISGGIFQKNIKNFIFVYQNRNYLDPLSGNVFTEYAQARNGGDASLLGFEFAFQRQFDFLPGFWKNFGIYTNYTLTSSRVNGVPVEGREKEKFSLPGTALHTGNAALSYESTRLGARLSLNLTSSYLDEIGDSQFNDRHYDRQIFLDFSGYYKFTPNLRCFVEANNLTNQPLRYFQGVRERVMQNEFYNLRLNAGIKFDLTK